VNGDGARTFFLFDIPVAIREFLDVAVEIQTDEFGVAVDDGRAGIAADCILPNKRNSAALINPVCRVVLCNAWVGHTAVVRRNSPRGHTNRKTSF
jgi:hypothetical protein